LIPVAVDTGRGEYVSLLPEREGGNSVVNLANDRVTPDSGDIHVVVARDPDVLVEPSDEPAAALAQVRIDVVPFGDALERYLRALGETLELLLKPGRKHAQPGHRAAAELLEVEPVARLRSLAQIPCDVRFEAAAENVSDCAANLPGRAGEARDLARRGADHGAQRTACVLR